MVCGITFLVRPCTGTRVTASTRLFLRSPGSLSLYEHLHKNISNGVRSDTPCLGLGRVLDEAETHLLFSTSGKKVPSQTSLALSEGRFDGAIRGSLCRSRRGPYAPVLSLKLRKQVNMSYAQELQPAKQVELMSFVFSAPRWATLEKS